MTLQQIHELDCEICNKIIAVNRVKEDCEQGSEEYMICISKEIAYTECLNMVRRYL